MIGVLITLLSATTFGVNHALVRHGVISGSAAQAVAVSMPVGLVFFILIAFFAGQLGEVARFSPFALIMLSAAGIVHFVFGRYCAYRAIAAMGVNLATPATQWSLLVSLVLAMVFLSEQLDAVKLAGIALIVAGPGLIVARLKRRATPVTNTSFKPRLVEGYTFASLACLGWGSSPVLVRAGLEGPGQALAGGVVSYAAATVVVAGLMLVPGPRRDVAAMTARHLRWFAGTSTVTAISQMLLYLAMALAPVIVVQPLLRFQTLAAAVTGWFINRQHESFDPGVLWAIGISMIGAVLLALDGQTLLQSFDLPAWLVPVLAWRWPGV
jgi:drug/metabolite transporter (DMT)-like permease